MDIEKIKELLALIEESETEEFEIELRDKDGGTIRIRKGEPDGYVYNPICSGNMGTPPAAVDTGSCEQKK